MIYWLLLLALLGCTPSAPAPPSVSVEEQQAVATARQRLPEFRSAFQSRQPGHSYLVKVPFTQGQFTELMWVRVEELNERSLRGTLENAPVEVRTAQQGQSVTVELDQVEDWLVQDATGKQVAGGFTLELLQE
ncbi:MAG: hypothetical protein AMXMBFR33_55330 [Candidatus Xenobia bacterium]